MELVKDIVERAIHLHNGGKPFFDHFDKEAQKPEVIDALFDKACESPWQLKGNFIVSGCTGRYIANYINKFRHQGLFIIVSGGLRDGIIIDDLKYMKEYIEDEEFIFLDDSFYSGRTRDCVRQEIERLGGKLIKTVVIYDGAKEKDPEVESLYRYYDEEVAVSE